MTRLDDIEARLAGTDLSLDYKEPTPVQVDANDLRYLLKVARAAEIPYRREVLKSGKVDIMHQYPQSTAHREGYPCGLCAALENVLR